MKSKWYGEDKRIGILGGGQLGRMLLQEAFNLNIHLHFLDPDRNAPCSKIAHSFTVGSFTDYETVLAFGKDKDLISVEIENVNIAALKALEKQGVAVFPQAHILELIQDKGLQKQFYVENNIPTAPFQLIENKADLLAKVQYPIVHKLRKGGYDGKGVQILKNEADAHESFDTSSLLEEKIPFVKELSVIVARTENGDTKAFPTVECEFSSEANLVEFLFAPAAISEELEQQAKDLAISVIEKLNMVGILAVEMFLDKEGNLLVNEIAPRPHNSGHHTIECNATSQFAQHLRAILNLPLGDTFITKAGAMINLLGEKGFEGKAVYEGLEAALEIPGVYPHIYGKEITKPFRKMGHVTITDVTVEAVKLKAKKVQNTIRVIC